MTVIIFIAILGLLVLVHEAGHFFVARKNGVTVEEFGFGIPPRMFGVWRDKNKKWHWIRKIDEANKPSATVYSMNWLPIGGFVKIKGEDGEATGPDSFSQKKLWQRSIIVAAGVTMNFVLTIFLLSIGFGIGMPAALESKMDSTATIKDRHIEITTVLKDSPAEQVGLMAGDTIVSINEIKFANLEEMRTYIKEAGTTNLNLFIKRDGEFFYKVTKTEFLTETNSQGLGIGLLEIGLVSYTWYLALAKGVTESFRMFGEIIKSFYHVFKNLLTGQGVSADLSGPVGIAVLTGQAARLGFVYLLQLAAMLSLNLAFINAMPFPALDGGRLLFFAIEAITGKPVKKEREHLAHTIGFFILLGLIALVTFRDVVHLLKG